jgi:acyl-CoA synthetase (AMP-forming)/AMP-acid ligase II
MSDPQVAPSELEDILRKHPKISDVAVIGVPNDESGEAPRAYIARTDEQLDEAEVHSYLEDKVSSFKYLKGGIDFVTPIPKAPSGKILRRELILAYRKENGIVV